MKILSVVLVAMFAVSFVVGGKDPSLVPYGPLCTAEGPGITQSTTLEKGPFTITTYNEAGERLDAGGAKITIKLISENGEVIEVVVIDNDNGTYSCYYISTISGRFTLEIMIGGMHIRNSPFHPSIETNCLQLSCNDCYLHPSGFCGVCAGELQEKNGPVPFAVCINSHDAYSCLANGNQILPSSEQCPVIDAHENNSQKQALQEALAAPDLSLHEQFLLIISHLEETKNPNANIGNIWNVFFSILGTEEPFSASDRALLCRLITGVFEKFNLGSQQCTIIGPVPAPAPPPTAPGQKRALRDSSYIAELTPSPAAMTARIVPGVAFLSGLIVTLAITSS